MFDRGVVVGKRPFVDVHPRRARWSELAKLFSFRPCTMCARVITVPLNIRSLYYEYNKAMHVKRLVSETGPAIWQVIRPAPNV